MTKLTVWGDCGGPDGAAATYRYGQLVEARSYRDLDLELPADGVEVDCDHDGRRVGELVHCELDDDNRLRAVAVLDTDRLAQAIEETGASVYFSPLLEMRGGGDGTVYIAREASLLGLSITFQTARVGATPVSWCAGDVRSSVDRYRWPTSWAYNSPLLERCVEHHDGIRERRARHIVDLRNRYDYGYPPPDDGYGYPTTRTGAMQRGAGRIEHGPPGRILSVR